MKLNSTTLAMGAAVAFAGFAIWYVTRGPGRLEAPTADQQRESGGLGFLATLDAQAASMSTTNALTGRDLIRGSLSY